MKKFITMILFVSLIIIISACRQKQNDRLVVYFVPSREASQILEATKPLKNLLKEELNNRGFEFNEVTIEVGASYEAVREALAAGTADIGFIPGGTYASMSTKDARVILTATRYGLNKDYPEAKQWNDGQPTLDDEEEMVTYYRSLIISGTSAAGRAIADKVNNDDPVTWDDWKNLNWCVRSSTSSAGYIYPTLWLNNKYEKTLRDVSNAVQTSGYGDTIAKLAAGQCDVGTIYADARKDYADAWLNTYNRTASIWEETNVVGVTDGIYNDTITVSLKSEKMNDELIKALQEAFIAIAETEKGLEIIQIYSHMGYKIAQDSDYDGERQAQELVKSLRE